MVCQYHAMESVDFVVIGGGIAGASAGYALAERGSVVLLEKEPAAGHHTTGRSAAIYTESYERGPVRRLTMAGKDFFDSPPDGFSEHPILSPLPVLYIAREDQRASVDEVIAASSELVDVERVTGPRLTDLCPVLNESIVMGVFEPDAMEIDVHELHQAFLRGIRRRGGVVHTRREVTELTHANGAWSVRASGEVYRAPVVVNAAGAWTDGIATLAGLGPLGLTPLRRTAFGFAPPEGLDISSWPIVIDVDEQFYFKPERTQIMGSLAEETPMHAHDVQPEEIDVALAIERIGAATTLWIRHVGRTWAGLRTFAPDRFPVVGFDPRAEGFFWLAGQGGYGIMTSPGMAEAAAGLVADGRLPERLTGFGLSAEELAPDRLLEPPG